MANISSLGFSVLSNRRLSANRLYESMRRLSTGEQITRPGDGPSEFGISESLRTQIRNSEAAKVNVENIKDLIRSTDSWLQVANDILTRMSELATASIDGSKTQLDRDKLQEEYDQLKDELTRISVGARYNSLQVAGRDQMLTYDLDEETFLLSQVDGSEAYTLPITMISGVSSSNAQDFLFDSTKDFSMSFDGKAIFYVDSNDHLIRYNLEENTLERDTTDAESKTLDVDEQGRLWYATETAAGSGVYSLRQQDVSNWTQDTAIVSNTAITDMASQEFKVYQNRVYYLDTNGDVVSRSLENQSEVKIELDSNDFTLNTTAGEFAISDQGLYVVDVQNGNEIRLINVETNEVDTFATGASSVTGLTFNLDSTTIAFNDTTEKSIYALDVKPGDGPTFASVQKTHISSGSLGYAGLSLDGGSHRTNFRVHNGPDAFHQAFAEAGDTRLFTLGITRVRVDTAENAAEGLGLIKEAREIVNIQRAKLGAAENRFMFSYQGITSYIDDISMAESRLREVDMAREAGILANEQVMFQATDSLILQANGLRQSVLRLFGQ